MANSQHIAWLQEGVEEWNARRQREDFTPDFSADFSGEKLGEAFVRVGKIKTVEGVPTIPLAGADLTDADFRGAELGGEIVPVPSHGMGFLKADFSGAMLTRADFTGAVLYKSNFAYVRGRAPIFKEAHLRGSDFSHASLRGPIFTDARLQESNFSHAYLSGANFTNANLSKVDFTDADIRYAKLEGAAVESGRLSKARNLSGSQPWMAKLFSAGTILSPIDLKLHEISHVGGFIETIQTMKTAYERSHSESELVMYFRGENQNYTDTSLTPSSMRDSRFVGRQSEMLRDLIARRPTDFSQAKSALDLWMLAQHHGLPTSFLDITRDPLVGLFFACENAQEGTQQDGYVHIFATPKSLVKPFDSDSVSVITNFARLSFDDKPILLGDRLPVDSRGTPYSEAMRRLYQLIQREKPYFEQRIDIADFYRVIVVEPQQSTERIRAQRGAFLISAFRWGFTLEEIRRLIPDIPIYAHHRLRVPHDRKEALREQLAMLSITRETLFPGLDSAAAAVKDSYKPKP